MKRDTLFDYTVTFVNSQHLNTNSKGDFDSKKGFERSFSRFLVYKINPTQIWYDKLKVKNFLHTHYEFLTFNNH